MSPIDTFEQDLREELERATSHAAPSLPEIDVTDLVSRGGRVVRRRRIVAGASALAVVAAVAVGANAASSGLDKGAELRPGQSSSATSALSAPSGIVATASGAVAIDKVPLPSGKSQGMRVDYWSGTRDGTPVVAVRLTPSSGAEQTLVYSTADIAAGRAVVWFDKHTAVALAPDESLAMLVTRTAEDGASGFGNLTGTGTQIIMRPFSASMNTAQPVGVVWKDHDGNGVGSSQLAVQSMKVSVLGRTDGCWASAVTNLAGCFFSTGATQQVWHRAGQLPSTREDDLVSATSILVVEVPAKDGVTFVADPGKPGQDTFQPVSVQQHGSAWWAAFEVPTRFLDAGATITWTGSGGRPGSGHVS